MTTFTHTVTVDGTDVTGIVLAGATITRGAGDGQPEPATAYLTLISADAVPDIAFEYPDLVFGDAIPSGFVTAWTDVYAGADTRLELGRHVVVGVTTETGFTRSWTDSYDGGYDDVRFAGRITAIDYTSTSITLTAVDDVEPLTRLMVNPSSFPTETETARVSRIAAYTGLSIDVVGTSSLTVTGYGPNSSQLSAYAMLTELASSCGSLLYATRDGHLTYITATGGTGSTVAVLEPGATLADTLTMSTELGRIANSITVTYGDNATVTVEDAASIGKYGKRSRSESTVLAEASAATAYGNRVLARSASPSWFASSATVMLALAVRDGWFPDNITSILATDLDDAVYLPQLLRAAPVPSYYSRVRGYVETLDPFAWSLTFSLDPAGWTSSALPELSPYNPDVEYAVAAPYLGG